MSGLRSASTAAASTPASADAPLAAAIASTSPAAAATQAAAAASHAASLPGKVLVYKAFSAAADPRLQGKQSVFVRVGVISRGAVGLTNHLAGAPYALPFEQAIIRYQLLAAENPDTRRTYIASVLQLQCSSLLGTSSGPGARGHLLASEDDLAQFEASRDVGLQS